MLLHVEGELKVRAVLQQIDAIEAQDIDASTVTAAYWGTLGNRLAAWTSGPSAAQLQLPAYTAERHASLRTKGALSLIGSHASRTAIAYSAAIGLAALAWASFTKPWPRLVYNPSNSVPVGWYRVEPLLRQPNQLRVGSIVLAHLPAEAAALAAQRGYLPPHVPLLKRVGAVPPQTGVHHWPGCAHRRAHRGRRIERRPHGPPTARLAAVPPPAG